MANSDEYLYELLIGSTEGPKYVYITTSGGQAFEEITRVYHNFQSTYWTLPGYEVLGIVPSHKDPEKQLDEPDN